jgi:hypothetical protein
LNVGRIVGGVLLVGGISLIAKFRSARRHIYSRGLSGSKTIFFSRREQYGNIVDSMFCLIYKEIYEMASEKFSSNRR